MITDSFSLDEPIIKPEMIYRRSEKLLDVCLITFSWKIFQEARNMEGSKVVGTLSAASGKYDIISLPIEGRRVGIFLSTVGAPACGGFMEDAYALTGAESRGNGGKYAYYNCCHDAKHIRKRAEVVNEGFAKYVGSLKPNETVLKLYENILEDVRKEQISDSLEEVELLKSKMQTFKNRIQRAKDLYLDGEMSKEEKDEAVSHNQKELYELQNKVDMLEMGNRSKIKPKLDCSISLINNMERYIMDAPVEAKIKLISSMFPQKIKFDGEKYRTNSYNQVLDLIYQETKQLREGNIQKKERSELLSNSVP